MTSCPGEMLTRESVSEAWAVEEFDWADPVGEFEYLKAFLDFRLKKMNEMFDKTPPSG